MYERRIDDAGAYVVDPDSRARIFERGAFCESNDSMLGRGICRHRMRCDETSCRSGVNDRAGSLLRLELPDFGAHAKPHSLQIDRADFVELILFVVRRFSLSSRDPGVVESAVEPSESLHRRGHHRLDVRCTGYVAAHELRFAAQFADRRDGLLAPIVSGVADAHSRALA